MISKLDENILKVIENQNCDEDIKEFLVEIFNFELDGDMSQYRRHYDKLIDSYIK